MGLRPFLPFRFILIDSVQFELLFMRFQHTIFLLLVYALGEIPPRIEDIQDFQEVGSSKCRLGRHLKLMAFGSHNLHQAKQRN